HISWSRTHPLLLHSFPTRRSSDLAAPTADSPSSRRGASGTPKPHATSRSSARTAVSTAHIPPTTGALGWSCDLTDAWDTAALPPGQAAPARCRLARLGCLDAVRRRLEEVRRPALLPPDQEAHGLLGDHRAGKAPAHQADPSMLP